MTVSDFTICESKVREAAATGTLVDLRVGESAIDSPERGTKWGPERTLRAEMIVDLLLGDGEAAAVSVRGVRVQGARITGELNLEAATLRCPLALLDCSFASAINLNEATAVSVRLTGSHVPAVHARQLLTRSDLLLDKGFSVSGGVELAGAHIGGVLVCTGGQFSNPDGYALFADRLTVNGGMFCDVGFTASGEVRLLGSHIGGVLVCTGGRFSNSGGQALTADRLTVEHGMFCDEGFTATSEVSLAGAHIGGQLSCKGGQFYNPSGYVLNAFGLSVEGDMFCDEGFAASGEVSLQGAHIGGQLYCSGGHFSNPGHRALNAYRLTVDGYMYCVDGFSASGEVHLFGARIGGKLACDGGHFSNSDGFALNLEGATVNGSLLMKSAVVEGTLNLTAAKISSYHDDPASWPQKLRLDGFVYDTIDGASAKERLKWLLRNENGYSPQIYDQLAAVYRRDGHDDDERRVLIAKQRRRFAQRNVVWKLGGYLLDFLVGYGYRTWLAALWLIGFLILGTWLFGSVYRGELTPANKPDVQPAFQPFFYTLDLLLPVVSLRVRDAWIAHGAAQVWSVIFIIMGWILATAVVLSLTGLLKRD